MLKKIKTRLRNPKVITALVAGILLVLVNTNMIDTGLSEKLNEVVNGILSIGVALGVFGNPESHLDE